jgi:hypothetical protein
MANRTPDQPLTPEQLEGLRQRFARMIITGLSDAYHAACASVQDGTGRKTAEGGVHSGVGAGVAAVEEGKVARPMTIDRLFSRVEED